MCLADRADDEGAAWPSIPGICEWTCLKRTAVISALKAIELIGFVAVVKESGKNNRFQLNLAAIAASNSLSPDQFAKRTGAPNEPVRETNPTSPPNEPPPVREANYTRPPGEPEASISIIQASESTINAAPAASQSADALAAEPSAPSRPRKSKAADDDVGSVEFPEWMPLELWSAFTAMRAKIKKPLTKEAVEINVKKLGRLRAEGHDPSGILEEAIANSWQGLYAPKAVSRPARTGGAHAGFAEKDYRAGANADGSF